MKNNLSDHTDIVGTETLKVISGANKFNRWMYEEIRPYLRGHILELGSGIGNISRMVLEDGFQTVLSDYNTFYVHQLQQEFGGYHNLVSVESIDLQNTAFEKNYTAMQEKFDTIFLLNVIEHLKDDHAAVLNCCYMLKPGGHLILLAPAYNWLYCNLDKNLGHHRRYTIRSLSALLIKSRMAIARKKYFNLAGITGWLIWGKLFRRRQLRSTGMNFFNRAVPFIRLADQLVFKKTGLSAIAIGKKI